MAGEEQVREPRVRQVDCRELDGQQPGAVGPTDDASDAHPSLSVITTNVYWSVW